MQRLPARLGTRARTAGRATVVAGAPPLCCACTISDCQRYAARAEVTEAQWRLAVPPCHRAMGTAMEQLQGVVDPVSSLLLGPDTDLRVAGCRTVLQLPNEIRADPPLQASVPRRARLPSGCGGRDFVVSGVLHRPRLPRRHRQHRGRRDRADGRRTRRDLLDVVRGIPRHGDRVRRGDARADLQGSARRRHLPRRSRRTTSSAGWDRDAGAWPSRCC